MQISEKNKGHILGEKKRVLKKKISAHFENNKCLLKKYWGACFEKRANFEK